jgi:hypothetical protein
MLGEQRNWDFAPDKGVPGINYRGKDGKLQWKELTAARKKELESQGLDVNAIIKDWERRYEKRTGKPYNRARAQAQAQAAAEKELMKQDLESARRKTRAGGGDGSDIEFRIKAGSAAAAVKAAALRAAADKKRTYSDPATSGNSTNTKSGRGGDSNGDGSVRIPTTKFDGSNTGSSSGIERRTPTSRELKAAQIARKLYRKSNPSDFAGAEKAAIRASLNPSSVLKTSNGSEKMTSNTGLPRLDAALSGSKSEFKFNSPDNRKKKTNEQMDTFDTIKEYLLSEGYAASEGAAHAIMTSMSEEWKQSILEQMLPPIDPKKHRAAQKTQKIYNKATQGAGSEKDFLRRTGPQLPGV